MHNVNLHPKCPRCRDAFAVAAMGLKVLDYQLRDARSMMGALAESCYHVADAMMAQREVRNTDRTAQEILKICLSLPSGESLCVSEREYADCVVESKRYPAKEYPEGIPMVLSVHGHCLVIRNG